MTTNKVSIIVPNYNAGLFISEFIDSVLAQTYANWELIIVDDGSTDTSKDIALNYALKDNRIKVLSCPDDNHGACQRRNQGLANATGEYICFCDSDDLLPVDTIEIRVKELEGNPSLDFVIVPAISFAQKPFDISTLALGLPIFKDDLKMFLNRFRLPFVVCTNLYRKEFLSTNHLIWDESLASLQDSDFNIRALSLKPNYKYADNQVPGYYWRVGGNDNSITKTIKSKKNLDSQLYFYKKLYGTFGETQYRKDLNRFGLTLLLRFALYDYSDTPDILLSTPSRKHFYKILKKVYRINACKKIYPLINLLFFPIPLAKEYSFLIKNRILCKKYIQKYREITEQDKR